MHGSILKSITYSAFIKASLSTIKKLKRGIEKKVENILSRVKYESFVERLKRFWENITEKK